MEENVDDMPKVNETNQSAIDEWKGDQNDASNNKLSNNDNNELNIEKQMNETSINDSIPTENVITEKQEDKINLDGGENVQNSWGNQHESKNYRGNKDNSGYRKGRGGFNKSKHGNNSLENSSGFDLTSTNSQNNGRNVRGRGRGFLKKFNEENESFGSGYNSNYNNRGGNTTPGHRGRGRGYHRGRGGRSSDGWYGNNNEDGHKKKENDKSNGPKPEYIPPDIENQESIAGIEAGLNFNKYETIEVKVSGTDPPKLMMSFHTSGLHNILLENLTSCNFSTPTPIQNYAIPLVITGKDLMASAQTGSGKTVSLFYIYFLNT